MKRGEIYYCVDSVTHGDVVWSEGRPCVIVSENRIAESEGNTVVQVVFLTTREKKAYPTHVRVTSSGRESTALCEQIVAIPKTALGTRIGECTPGDMSAIDAGLLAGLGLCAQTEPRVPNDRTRDQLTVAIAERNVYKRLYEQLVTQLLGVQA